MSDNSIIEEEVPLIKEKKGKKPRTEKQQE
jgi:hypothetical protein